MVCADQTPVCPCCGREACCREVADELVRLRQLLVRLVEWDFGKVYPVTPSQALKDIVSDARGEVLGSRR
jgi:hypothetical protein